MWCWQGQTRQTRGRSWCHPRVCGLLITISVWINSIVASSLSPLSMLRCHDLLRELQLLQALQATAVTSQTLWPLTDLHGPHKDLSPDLTSTRCPWVRGPTNLVEPAGTVALAGQPNDGKALLKPLQVRLVSDSLVATIYSVKHTAYSCLLPSLTHCLSCFQLPYIRCFQGEATLWRL